MSIFERFTGPESIKPGEDLIINKGERVALGSATSSKEYRSGSPRMVDVEGIERSKLSGAALGIVVTEKGPRFTKLGQNDIYLVPEGGGKSQLPQKMIGNEFPEAAYERSGYALGVAVELNVPKGSPREYLVLRYGGKHGVGAQDGAKFQLSLSDRPEGAR